ncbi:MAG: UDP-N-acetylmuramoyl-L-alanyl-D-glutamate--2,6-diaminopimelate ligase [Candidatus Sungbacteria bacterium]|uniref:UDP-N-acetylmuramoyl-L-alanyl-D-glutamate--2, 6-diaminopimelate ligase n=1 Tax=Candidatus Sungiibacteriota bacterium TaxID=2750080 RepID=A0A932YW15_9BACT|nr:UDP-N-acetylmuramoyl-L-alanyl-D-glutamate--2,6-diaminopimelate ligase [Candidatus Sungbacteria bacterium]
MLRLKKAIPPPLVRLLHRPYHFTLAALAAFGYGFPSRGLVVIGVTGTNGKTTVVHLLHEIFSSAGYSVGSLSSLRFKIRDAEEANLLKMTMPGRFRLQRFLARCRAEGCRFVILEVTSEGIKQFRHRFIRFSGAVLTNITPEHIESHGSFERYRAAKLELFQRLPPRGIAILNREDESTTGLEKRIRAEIVWYSRSAIEFKHIGHPVRVLTVRPERIQLEVDNMFLETRLGGMFNVMNVLAASAAVMACGVSLSAVAQALDRVSGIPGRLEYVSRTPIAVVVDYAHTPDALGAVYKSLSLEVDEYNKVDEYNSGSPRKLTNLSTSKLICVLGSAGGGRDKWKRPELGKIAARFCKAVILTSEDPDDEDPARIASEIRSGISNSQPAPYGTEGSRSGFSMSNVHEVLDRREAIREALRSARPGDTVVITGMGVQPWFINQGEKIPWDERKIVKEELAHLST